MKSRPCSATWWADSRFTGLTLYATHVSTAPKRAAC